MPSRSGPRKIVEILPRAELITMVLLGMVRNAMNWFSFTWNRNVQEVWNLPGPEPSFTAKYHFDYWLKNVLSLVVLFRNFTTHLHLLFYIVMLYPVLTGERPRLMLPWLYLQMAKNIVTDVICTVAGVLLCWTLHSCGLLTLEFFVVRIISMMPSIYLWRRLRSYYFDLYYAELDGENSFPVMKAKQGQGPTLAQRRRASKSLDGTVPLIASSDNRSRFNSCVTYDEFFGPANWEANTDDKVSKSLTTLLTIESQESDDVEEDSSLQIIDGENLTPAEKTLKILGLTREEVDATVLQTQKTTSTSDLEKSEALSLEPFTADKDLKSSYFSVTGEAAQRRVVGVQVRFPDLSKSTSLSKEQKGTGRPKKCECCEETKCSKENDTDSDEEEPASTSQSTKNVRNGKDRLVREIPLNCCDQNRTGRVKPSEIRDGNKKRDDDNEEKNPETVLTTSEYCKNDMYLGSGLEAVVKRDGIVWENLKEINFVSVINKALCNDTKPFNLSKDGQNPKKSIRETFRKIFEDSEKKLKVQSDQTTEEIIPEHEDGTKFIHRLQRSSHLEVSEFYGPTSASFGAASDILATNASFVFQKTSNFDAQSIESTVTAAKQMIRLDHDTEFDSYFKSSFQNHCDMFDETRAQLEPFQGEAHSSNYGAVDRVNEDLQSYQTAGNPVREKTDCSYYSLDLYRSRCNTPQYQPESYEVRDIPENMKSKDFEKRQITSDLKASQTSAIIISKRDNSTTPFINEKSTDSKSSRQKSSRDRRTLASVSKMSRSSKNQETPEERETKEMQALRAYNEKTLLKYKREMDACDREKVRVQDEFPFYVPSAPELEKPEEELILNIEKAYARFARSKPVDPVSSEAKDFFEICSGSGRVKKDSRKIKFGDKTAMRKQHSKYSKLSAGTKGADVTSRESCKLVEGSQKGRELERTLAKENIRADTVEVYFVERQIDDKPSTSKNSPIITTIKSFSRKNDPDLLSTESSETLTSQGTRSPMVEVLNNPEEIPRRIEDNEYYRQLRRNNLPNGVREAVRNIDWSFQRSTSVGNNRRQEKRTNDTCAGVARVNVSSENQDIVHKSTEHMLQRVFANSENSVRGFRLEDSADEFYPIFSTVTVAMEEIVRAAALRGLTDEFISQPATEIETPEIEDGNLYGQANLPSDSRHRSSSGFVKCSILPEDNRAGKKRSEIEELQPITTTVAPEIQDKKREALRREADPLDQDESPSAEDEEASFLLSKSISTTEPRSGKVNTPVPKKVEDFSTKKQFFPSRRRSLEHSLQIGEKRKEISSERVRLALHDIIFQSLKHELPEKDDSRFKSPLASYRGILDCFDTGGKELRSIVFDFFDQYPNYVTSVRNGESKAEGFPIKLKGSDFVPQLQMLTNLYAIQTKVGEIISASEEPPSSSTGNSSFGQDNQPERATTQTETNFENVTTNTSTADHHVWKKNDRDKGEDSLGEKKIAKVYSKSEDEASFPDEFGKSRDDDKRLLSSILDSDSASIADSELLNRANFKRQVISSGFAQAIKQSPSFLYLAEGGEAEILAPKDEDRKVENEVFAPNYERHLKINSSKLAEAEMLELWITDDEEQATSRTTLVCPTVDEVSLVGADNATPVIVMRDIETAECAIKTMKTIFEKFLAEGRNREEKIGKHDAISEIRSKLSPLTHFSFPLNCELQKLQNLVQTVANYVTIARSSSTKSIESSNEPIESHIRRKELNAGCGTESSDNVRESSESLTKNGVKSNTDNCQTTRFSLSKTSSSLKSSKVPERVRNQLNHFSSWDKVIPLSTKRQIAKGSRKKRLKNVTAASEPARRVVKVVKLTEKKSVEFFGARSVPQRGRGLSSGYLMDSDSDGNFTVSRPPTPVSLESETSLTLSGESEQLGPFPKPLVGSEISTVPTKSQSRTTNRSIEVSDNNASETRSRDIFLQSTRNATYDEETHVLGAESLSTASDLQYMTSVDAAEIENKLKDVVQKILSHQFRGVNPLINGLRIGSKNASFTSISDCARTASSAGLQSKDLSPKNDVKEQQQIKQDCQKRIQELLHKSENASYQQLNAHYRNLDSTSKDSDAVSFEVTPRKSRVSVRSVAIGTEYNIEVFKDLLDMFEKIHSIGEKSIPRQTSKSSGVENGNDARDDCPTTDEDEREITEHNSDTMRPETVAGEVMPAFKENYEIVTTSYDSFSSAFSRYTIDVSESSRQAVSISNHTYFEEFPEQVDSSFAMTPKICDVASLISGESVNYSLGNPDENSNHVTPGINQSNNESKKDLSPSPKKKGIPRPVKSNRERK